MQSFQKQMIVINKPLLYTNKVSHAELAELADALDLGSSVNDVGVQVPYSAPTIKLKGVSQNYLK